MVPTHFSHLECFQKKRDTVIYKASEAAKSYILKCALHASSASREAFTDEYETLAPLAHPSLPTYYGLFEEFPTPDGAKALTLCMEYREGRPLHALAPTLSLAETLAIVKKTGEILAFLLENGILYTDLHPANILVCPEDLTRITLLDFTYCYYFLRNPNPSYRLRFSYDLLPARRGQQLLIQELTLLLGALLEMQATAASSQAPLPSALYMLLETGNHPSPSLALADFLSMIEQCVV